MKRWLGPQTIPVLPSTGSRIFRPRLFGADGGLDRITGTITMKPHAEDRAMLARMERARA
jgi:hypothetical protein